MGAEANRFASATTIMGRLHGDKKPSPGAKERSHNIVLFKVKKNWGIFLLSVPLLIGCWKRKVSCLFCEQKMYIHWFSFAAISNEKGSFPHSQYSDEKHVSLQKSHYDRRNTSVLAYYAKSSQDCRRSLIYLLQIFRVPK